MLRSTVVALLCLPIVATAQDWGRDAAISEVRELVLTKRPMAEWPERDRAIAMWLDHVATSGVDLGDHRFLVGVAQYFVKDYEPAARTLLGELERLDGVLPTKDFDTIVGRALLAEAVRAIRAGDYTAPRPAVEHAARLYEDGQTVYRALCTPLASVTSESGVELLDFVLGRMFADERLTAAQRQAVLKLVYAPPARGTATPAAASASRGGALKPFEAKDLDGNPISLTALEGKVVLVDFWATWCGPCMREMPNVVAAHQRFAEKGFSVVGISLDQEPGQQRGGAVVAPTSDSPTVAKIRAAMERLGMNWPIVYEGGGWETRLAVENGIRSIPATFLLDRQGKVCATNLRGAELERKIAELIGEGQ